MASEGYVGVAADGSGKTIRTREVKVMLDDGSIGTMEMQVVAIANSDGKLIDLELKPLLKGILQALLDIKELLELKG